jgi:hypothetical protein
MWFSDNGRGCLFAEVQAGARGQEEAVLRASEEEEEERVGQVVVL